MREFRRILNDPWTQRPRFVFGRVILVAACGLGLSGCSMTFPMGNFGDDVPTGTIKPASVSPLSTELDGEDWRRAKSAMETALDPQGNGTGVTWNNPQSGAKGIFIPTAQAYAKDDAICRPFRATVETKGEGGRAMRSSACRKNGGEWVMGVVKPMRAATAGPPTTVGPRSKINNVAERDTNTQLN